MQLSFGYTLRDWAVTNVDQKRMIIDSCLGAYDLDSDDIDFARRNVRVFCDFVEEAFKVRSRRDRYSARTIIELLRHHTIVSDDSDTYKISDHLIPIFSRLSMYIFPELDGFFKLKGRKND